MDGRELEHRSGGQVIRQSRSRMFAWGSTSITRAHASSETKVVFARAPSSLPAKSQFRRPRNCLRRLSYLILLCAGSRPSSMKRMSATRFLA